MEDKTKIETDKEKLERLRNKLESLGNKRTSSALIGTATGVVAEMWAYLYLTHQSGITVLKPWAECSLIGMVFATSLLSLMKEHEIHKEMMPLDMEETKLSLGPGLYSKKREETKLEVQKVKKHKNIGIGLSVAGLSAAITGMISGASLDNPIDKMVLATLLFVIGNAVLAIGSSVAIINSSEEKILRRRQRYLN